MTKWLAVAFPIHNTMVNVFQVGEFSNEGIVSVHQSQNIDSQGLQAQII